MFDTRQRWSRTWMRVLAAAAVAGASMVGVAAHAAPTPATPTQSREPGKTRTSVAGSWQATPSAIFTGVTEVEDCQLSYTALASLMGSFTGTWHEESMTTSCDTSYLPEHLYYHASGVGTLTGVASGNHSRGSLTWTGTWDGDAISGESTGRFFITGGSGDPTFGCSSGRLTFDGSLVAAEATGFGGYSGSWVHGCRK